MKTQVLVLFTFLVFSISNICLAQDTCITLMGNVILTSQAQLDAYWQQNPGICIDTIEGDLILAGVSDISGFMGLRYIGGGILAPTSNPVNPSLRGLDSLTEIDDYLILNTQVYDLDALSNLKTIGRNIDHELTGGLSKSVTFGSGSYDNLDALINLHLAHDCRLSISNCDVRDASGLRNVSGLRSLFLGGGEIEIFPDLPYVDTLHRLMINQVTGLSELAFSGLEYVNELYISDAIDLKSLTFNKPVYMGRRKRIADDEFYDRQGAITIAGEIECLTAEFRRADSLEFLEVTISGLPLRPDCPAPDLSNIPMDRLSLSGIPTGDTLILPFHLPNDQFSWGKTDRDINSSNYGVEYRLIGLPDVKYLVVPDTGNIAIRDLENLEEIDLDRHAGRGQLQSFQILNANSLVQTQVFKQIHGSLTNYDRPTSSYIQTLEIKDCINLELDRDDFSLIDSAISIQLENLPSVRVLPRFNELEYVEDFRLKNVPIHDDTLFSDKVTIEHFLSFDFISDNPLPAHLHLKYDTDKDTLTTVRPDGLNGIRFGYWGRDISVTGLNNVTTAAGLDISGAYDFTLDGSNLLSNLSQVNSYLLGRPSFYTGRNSGILPKIGKIDHLFEVAFLRDNGTWFTRNNNRQLAIFEAVDITDATAVCPLINSGNYELLDLDPSNSYPLYGAAALVNYCDSNRVSSSSELGQWKAFAAYPTINSAGGSINFKGLEDYTGTLQYRVISVAGQEVAQGNLVSGSYGRVDAIVLPNSLPEGQYFLDVLDDRGRRGTSVIQVVVRP